MAEGDQPAAACSPDSAEAAPGAPAPQPGVLEDPATSGDEPVSPLQAELEMVLMERDDYRQKLATVEAELAALTAASPEADTINKLQQDNEHLRKTLRKATDMLREKITVCSVQEKKNSALTQQVKTLKEVLQVTRDLLNIRNLEVEQLQKNVDSMEARIDDNRRRQSAMIQKLEKATKINGELRNEYETQFKIFQSLKERYEEKVTALTNLVKLARKRSNSEGSEKFEDAPETVEVTESTSEVEYINVSNTDSVVLPVCTPESADTTGTTNEMESKSTSNIVAVVQTSTSQLVDAIQLANEIEVKSDPITDTVIQTTSPVDSGAQEVAIQVAPSEISSTPKTANIS